MNLELKYIGVTKLLSRLFNQGTCGLTPDGSDIEDVEQAMRDFQATFPGRFAVLRQGDQFHIEPINMAQAQDQGSVDMAHQAYQKRVVDEKQQLDEKIQRLKAFLNSPQPSVEYDALLDLSMQLRIMEQYSCILATRISKFKVG